VKNYFHAAFWTIYCVLLLTAGCSTKPDPSKEFGMYFNGEENTSALDNPIGLIQEHEAGFSYSYSYSIIFPLKKAFSGPVPRPGVYIEFTPERINLGEETPFEAGSESAAFVEYHPVTGHKVQEATLLVYSTRHGDGGGKIRLDVFEPRLGGRIKGTIIQATLNGYYEDMEKMEITELEQPRKLELFNWSFDVILQRGPF